MSNLDTELLQPLTLLHQRVTLLENHLDGLMDEAKKQAASVTQKVTNIISRASSIVPKKQPPAASPAPSPSPSPAARPAPVHPPQKPQAAPSHHQPASIPPVSPAHGPAPVHPQQKPQAAPVHPQQIPQAAPGQAPGQKQQTPTKNQPTPQKKPTKTDCFEGLPTQVDALIHSFNNPHIEYKQKKSTEFQLIFKAFTPAMPVLQVFTYSKYSDPTKVHLEKYTVSGSQANVSAVTLPLQHITKKVDEWLKEKPVR